MTASQLDAPPGRATNALVRFNESSWPGVFGAAILALLLLAHSLFKPLDHDEHQFVASGALLARHGVLPYRDYPYFHVPYLVAIYAAIFLLTDHLLLGARLCSYFCSIATFVVLSARMRWLLREQPRGFRRLVIFASVLILLASPAVQATTGRAWNHDLPTLVLLVAYLVASADPKQPISSSRFIMCGALVGFATGTRLTFAPAAGAFVLAILTCPSITRPQRCRHTFSFLLGFTVALIPCALFIAMAPRQFIFGTFQYPLLNMVFRQSKRYLHGVTASEKLRVLFVQVLGRPGNLFILLVLIVSFAALRRQGRDAFERRFDLRLLMLLVVMLLVGALVPTPLFPQYFFTPAVFMVLASVAGISCGVQTELRRTRWT
jgi:hypothetical protein